MKKRKLNSKLRLRKSTLRSLDEGALQAARGGHTEAGSVCDQLTLSPHCALSCDTCVCDPFPSAQTACSFTCSQGACSVGCETSSCLPTDGTASCG